MGDGAGGPDEGAAAFAASPLVRAALFVADLGRATAFYRALGLTETYFEDELDDPSATACLGVPGETRVRARVLKRPGFPNFGMVGLFELTEPAPEALPPPAGPPRVGEAALVFYVSDMDAALAALRALGAGWSPPPTLFRLHNLVQREVCLRDPDGVLLNLIEADPARAQGTRSDVVKP